MSRCNNCNLSFEEENGWQEFCSTECAREFFTKGKKGSALSSASIKFDEWISDPRNARTVRSDGSRATPPQIGKIVERTYRYSETVGKGKKVRQIRKSRVVKENIGSQIVIRPITDKEREIAIAWRGRGSFGENHVPRPVTDYVPGEHGLSRVSEAWFPHD